MWKDSPHFACTDTYRNLVFKTHALGTDLDCLHVFKRGHFIEDTLGQKMIDALKRATSTKNIVPTEAAAAAADGEEAGSGPNLAVETIAETKAETKASVFSRFGTYLLQCAKPCIFHLDGRVYVPVSQRGARGYLLADFETQRARMAEEFVHRRKSACEVLTEDTKEASAGV
jgi:hypothetical protein